MNPALQGLQLVLEHAQAQADAARAQLQRSEGVLEQIRTQGQALADYERETTARWHAAHGQARGVAMLQAHSAFLHKLAAARVQQQAQQNQAQQAAARCKAVWQQAQTRVAALERLIAKRQGVAQREQLRREQRDLDALSSQRGAAQATFWPGGGAWGGALANPQAEASPAAAGGGL